MSGRNADCVLPLSLMALKGLHLIESYAGKVVTPDNLSVGTLELASGSIGQSYAMDGMNDLRITQLLSFTGGALNSSAPLGTVHLTGANGVGATAELSPGTGAITIGSTLSLEGLGYAGGGATMGMSAGQYTFTNEANVIVGTY